MRKDTALPVMVGTVVRAALESTNRIEPKSGISSPNFVQLPLRKNGRAAPMNPPVFTSILFCITALTLVSCGSDGPGAIWVDPGKFTLYHCDDDFSRRLKELTARENELRGLIDKANESAAGAVIGSIAYRSDYDAVLAEEKLLQRKATEKKCGFTTEYQSDQIVR